MPHSIAEMNNATTSDDEEGPSEAYQERLQLKQMVDRLVDAGFSTQIDLPQVVVVGGQSCGKSSLFEGISGVSLPRDAGTCTRCPIICRMSRKPGRWRCTISILRETEHDEDSLPSKSKIEFGPVIFDKKDVCKRILRAQDAILHPKMSADIFWKAQDLDHLRASLSGTPKSEFSFDSIQVVIEGSSVQDLSFVDLPGIITNDEDANVERVKNLVTKYVQNEASLILLVYKCNDDLHNQGAGTLARRYDPTGRRTIVALTNPDRIDRGQGEDWLKMLKTSKNCFCVRQPDREDVLRGMTRSKARGQEMEFFQTGKWLDLYNNPSTRGRLGTGKLTNHLNVRLFEWIAERLPKMQDDMRKHLRETKDALRRFPECIDDPVRFADDLLWAFDKGLRDSVDVHNFQIPELVGNCRRRLEKFVEMLFYYLFPRFCPNASAKSDGLDQADLEELPAASLETSKSKFRDVQIPETVYLDEIIVRSDLGRTRELPRNYPYGILKKYVEASVEVWRDPTEDMLEEIYGYISCALESLVSQHFGSLISSKQAILVWRVVIRHLESRRDAVRKAILASLKREKANSQVFGISEFSRLMDVYLEHYLSQLRISKESDSFGDILETVADFVVDAVTNIATGVISAETGILPGAVKAGVDFAAEGLNITDGPEGSTTRTPTPQYKPSADEMNAIEVMAQTQAFYHIAVRRYAEGTAQIIFHDLLLDIQDGSKLLQDLRKEVGIFSRDAHELCLRFIEPSEETRKERSDLEAKRALLEEVLEEMHIGKQRGPLTGLTADNLRNHRERENPDNGRYLDEVLIERSEISSPDVLPMAGTSSYAGSGFGGL